MERRSLNPRRERFVWFKNNMMGIMGLIMIMVVVGSLIMIWMLFMDPRLAGF